MAERHTGPMNFVDKAMDKIGGMLGKTKASGTDDAGEFVENAAIGNAYELKAAHIAKQRTQNQQVREFAEQMIADHEHAKNELQSTLTTHPDAPNTPDGLDSRREQMVEHLEKAPDEEFDARYAEQQDLAHQETVKLFESYADEGGHAGLKRFAAQMLPTLREHLEKAQALRSRLDGAH
ncbi:MAG: DUF4142 domain-containing protein [Oceanicaulis sp.]